MDGTETHVVVDVAVNIVDMIVVVVVLAVVTE